jgi:hypothetical protein
MSTCRTNYCCDCVSAAQRNVLRWKVVQDLKNLLQTSSRSPIVDCVLCAGIKRERTGREKGDNKRQVDNKYVIADCDYQFFEIYIALTESYFMCMEFNGSVSSAEVIYIGCSERRLIRHSFYRQNFLRKSCATCQKNGAARHHVLRSLISLRRHFSRQVAQLFRRKFWQ